MASTGNLYAFITQQAHRGLPALSFMHERFDDIDRWSAETRDYLRSLLMYSPEPVDLAPELVDFIEYPEYSQQKWYVSPSEGERMPLILLLPRGQTIPAPAIIALHCAGGMYYFGKKKLVPEENEPQRLIDYRQTFYDGVPIAAELARRGYVVAVIDSFYFGERRMTVPPTPALQQDFLLVAEGSERWIELLDQLSGEQESVLAKSLTWAGLTWPGILAWDDMRTVDFLLTRPEVDPARIGCVGWAMGGLRAALLGALDPRVKTACVVDWMSTFVEMLEDKVGLHSWSSFIPGLSRVLDWPDVASLHAPNPLLVMQSSQNEAFPLDGYQKAAERLRALYAKAGVPGNLDIALFDQPRGFSLPMQQHAWDFFDRSLDVVRQDAEMAVAE